MLKLTEGFVRSRFLIRFRSSVVGLVGLAIVFVVPFVVSILIRGGLGASADITGVYSFLSPGDNQVTINVAPNGAVQVGDQTARGAIKPHGNGTELRLSLVKSPGFAVDHLAARVVLPDSVNATSISDLGADIVSEHGVGQTNVVLTDPHTLTYQIFDIAPTADVTIVAQLPPGAVRVSIAQRLFYAPAWIWLSIGIGFLLVTLVVLGLAVARQLRTNRVGKSSRVLSGPPTALPPAVAGALVDGKVGARELAATLVDLANRGFLYISRRGEDFVFARRRSFELSAPVEAISELPRPGSEEVMPQPPVSDVFRVGDPITDPGRRLQEPNVGTSTDLRGYERALLSKIFLPQSTRSSKEEIAVRVGRHVFSRRIAQVYWGMYQEATNLGYFEENPSRVHVRYRSAGIVLFFVSVLGLVGSLFLPQPTYPMVVWVATLIAAALSIGLSGFMSIHTSGGRTATEAWLGFKNFLEDETPIGFSIDSSELFARYLPYAIAFGVEVEWSQRFLNHAFHPPEWFGGTSRIVSLENFIGALFPIVRNVAEIFAESKEPIVQ